MSDCKPLPNTCTSACLAAVTAADEAADEALSQYAWRQEAFNLLGGRREDLWAIEKARLAWDNACYKAHKLRISQQEIT